VSVDHEGVFLLDSNVFIEAHRRYYALDICPGFWECLTHHCRQSHVLSIDRVRGEIKEGDHLDEWMQQAPKGLFATTKDEAVAKAFGNIQDHVQDNARYKQEAKAEFARVADGWLIAYAIVHKCTVVTLEVPREGRNKVQIPDVCDAFKVRDIDTYRMLRSLKAEFNWRT